MDNILLIRSGRQWSTQTASVHLLTSVYSRALGVMCAVRAAAPEQHRAVKYVVILSQKSVPMDFSWRSSDAKPPGFYMISMPESSVCENSILAVKSFISGAAACVFELSHVPLFIFCSLPCLTLLPSSFTDLDSVMKFRLIVDLNWSHGILRYFTCFQVTGKGKRLSRE